jgi:hypothetical protein
MRDTPDKAAALMKSYGPIEACWGNSKVRELIDSLNLRRVLTGPYSKGLRRPGLSAMKVSASASNEVIRCCFGLMDGGALWECEIALARREPQTAFVLFDKG